MAGRRTRGWLRSLPTAVKAKRRLNRWVTGSVAWVHSVPPRRPPGLHRGPTGTPPIWKGPNNG